MSGNCSITFEPLKMENDANPPKQNKKACNSWTVNAILLLNSAPQSDLDFKKSQFKKIW